MSVNVSRNFHYGLWPGQQHTSDRPCMQLSAGFSAFGASNADQRASFATAENAKAQTVLSLIRYLRHPPVPCLLVA